MVSPAQIVCLSSYWYTVPVRDTRWSKMTSAQPARRRMGAIHAGLARNAAAAAGVCVPLDTPDNALESVGGKGRSLSNMARAGFHVPGALR